MLEEYGFSWFPQNKDALQCPQRNYLEKLMQTLTEKKEERGKKKKKEKKIDLYAYI